MNSVSMMEIAASDPMVRGEKARRIC